MYQHFTKKVNLNSNLNFHLRKSVYVDIVYFMLYSIYLHFTSYLTVIFLLQNYFRIFFKIKLSLTTYTKIGMKCMDFYPISVVGVNQTLINC